MIAHAMRRAPILIALIALAGCGGGDSAETFDKSGFDVTFEYPSEMDESDKVSIAQSAGNAARATEGVQYTKQDVIAIQRYDLNREIDEDNIDLAKAELDRLVTQLSSGAEPGDTGKVGEFDSVEYEDLELRQPEGARTRLIALFDGDTEYLINCQYTPDRKDDIEKACDQILESIEKK